MINAMKHSRPRWYRHAGVWLITGIFLVICACEKKQSDQEIKPIETGGMAVKVDYSELLARLLERQQMTMQNPSAAEPRRELLEIAVYSEARKVFAAGIGKPPADARSNAIAQQNAERAAFIDGCRWAAYILAWNEDLNTPDFGRIKSEIPSCRVVYKNTHPEEIQVVVEADIR